MFELQVNERGLEVGTIDYPTLPIVGGTFEFYGEPVKVLSISDAGGYWVVEIKY